MLLVPLALAQEIPDSDNIDIPDLDGDLVHRSLGTWGTLITEGAGRIRESPAGSLAAGMGYVNAPLVVSWDAGGGEREQVAVLRDALVVDLMGTLEHERFRLGIDLPVYLLGTSDLRGPGGAELGNVAFDGRFTVMDPTASPIGLGVIARLDLPSPALGRAIASPRVGYELAGTAEAQVDAVGLFANVGYRGVPREPLYNVIWDDMVFLRLAGSYALNERAGVSLEATGAVVLNAGDGVLGSPGGAPTPAEALAGGWFAPVDGLAVRGGVGTGLSGGIGSPRLRLLADVVWTPSFGPRDADGDGLDDRDDACPEEPEDRDGFRDEDGCPDWDNDGDGLSDPDDACPDQAEDVDDFQDEDGCPDPKSTVLLRVVNEIGELVPGAILQISAEGMEPISARELELHPGDFHVVAFAPGHASSELDFTVGLQGDAIVTVPLQRNPPGVARVSVQASGGVPEGMAVRFGGRAVPVEDGAAELLLYPGVHVVEVDAMVPYAAWRGSVTIQSAEDSALEIRLARPRLRVVDGRLIARERLSFEEGTADLMRQSESMLGELAALLVARPGQGLRVEVSALGDTVLAERRAKRIERRLVRAGVDPSQVERVVLDAGTEAVELVLVDQG